MFVLKEYPALFSEEEVPDWDKELQVEVVADAEARNNHMRRK